MFKDNFNRFEFLRTALAWQNSVTPKVILRVAMFTSLSVLSTFLCLQFKFTELSIGILEVSGAVVGLLLIVRTNAGYDRWWEARKLWGGIVNQSRNIAIGALNYGPSDGQWRNEFLRATADFSKYVCQSLREQSSNHKALSASYRQAALLKSAYVNGQVDGFSFSNLEKQRALLVDHWGACERILKTPLPKVLDIKVRRFLLLYLALLPIGLVSRIGWNTPLLMFFVSYSVLAVDQIGIELQNPFDSRNLSSLPIGDISNQIEKQIMSLNSSDSFGNAKTESNLKSLSALDSI